MIALPPNARVWLAAGSTDMRKGFDGLAGLVQTQLAEDPFNGHGFEYSPDRKGERPLEHLKDYHGILQADGTRTRRTARARRVKRSPTPKSASTPRR